MSWRLTGVFGACLVAVMVLASASGMLWHRSQEPTIRGEKLSRWLAALYEWPSCGMAYHVASQVSIEDRQARAAVRAMTDRDWEWTARLLAAQDSSLERWLKPRLQRYSFARTWIADAEKQHSLALHAFMALREQASPAIPSLTSLLHISATSENAAFALKLIGAGAIPALQSGLTNSSPEVRVAAIEGFVNVSVRANGDVELPASILRDPDPTVRYRVLALLVSLPESSQGRRAVEDYLGDPIPVIRIVAAHELIERHRRVADACRILEAESNAADKSTRQVARRTVEVLADRGLVTVTPP